MPLKKLASITEELRTGVWPSVHRRQIPLWEDVSNVVFSPNGVAKIQGYAVPATATALAAPLRGGGQLLENDGSAHVYIGDHDRLYRWDGGATITQVGSGFTGIEDETSTQMASTWSMVPFGDWMLATNGVDAPQVMKGSAASAAALGGVSGNFTEAEIFTILNEHIIALNTSNSPYEIRWSTAGNAEIWTPSTTNSAGFLSLREARSPIMAGVPLQEVIGIYTREGLFLLEYVGSPSLRFRTRHVINGIGALSKQAVVPVSRINYGVGIQGFWKTDGNTFAYIDEPAVKDYFRSNLAAGQSSKVCAYHNEDETSVVWYFPTTDEPDRGLVFNYSTNTWSILGYGRTTALERNAYSTPISGGATGLLYQDNSGNDAGAGAITSYARTKGLDFGEETYTKHITGLRINYIGSGLRARIGYKNSEADALTWGSYKEITSGDLTPFRESGKLIYIEVQSQDTGDNWEIFSADIYGRIGGMQETV